MIQRSEDLRFALEPGDAVRIGCEGLWQDLDRDVAVEPSIARAIDLSHAAHAERRDDFKRAESSAWDQRQ
jgi:hypothetical protein